MNLPLHPRFPDARKGSLLLILLLGAGLVVPACGGNSATPAPPPTPPAPPPTPPAPPPAPRVCTDERERARAFLGAVLPGEWDGTPFSVDLFDHFPAIAGADYPARQLEEVAGLADQIEGQLGYRIIEAGGVVPPPRDLPADWNDGSNDGVKYCEQWRKPGQIVGVHLESLPPGHRGGGALAASPWCAFVTYYVGDGPLTGAAADAGRTAIVHELFHLFGFEHLDDLGRDGIPMSRSLTYESGGGFRAGFDDIDALRCVFPEGG